jgi:hypothetical protein
MFWVEFPLSLYEKLQRLKENLIFVYRNERIVTWHAQKFIAMQQCDDPLTSDVYF